jgi:conjugative relaxase-like TrwC/TraI family protein
VDYLTRHIARGDGAGQGLSLAAYYAASGYPPGVWIGIGLAGVDSGRGLAAGSRAEEDAMARLFGRGQDPVSGAPLGRPPAVPRPGFKPVVGFDLTFSVPKSVSGLWGLAEPGLRARIEAAHHEAIAAVLTVVERDAARTRTGAGGAVQVPTRGLIAAAFDHYDSRDGDPQLHTHVTVANKVQGPDGVWRTLYSQRLFRSAVAMSELYDGALADAITRELGLSWEWRERGPGRNPARELAAIPAELIAEFSKRAARIDRAKEQAIGRFVTEHGRRPTDVEVIKLRQTATLATRQAKRVLPLSDYTRLWRARAATITHRNMDLWSAQTVTRNAHTARLRTSSRVAERDIEILAAATLTAVEAKRSTWSSWNVDAEAARQIAATGVHFATASDLIAVRDRVARSALDRSVLLNPTAATRELGMGIAGAEPAAHRVFTSLAVLAAEDRLLAAADDRSGPVAAPIPSTATLVRDAGLARVNHAEPALFEIASRATTSGPSSTLTAADRARAAVAALATSGRVADVLVGPAGAGKSTAMRQLRETWEATFGPESVTGLAPSAAAARVLGAETGMAAETTAQWIAQQAGETRRLDTLIDLQRHREKRVAAGVATNDLDAKIAEARAVFDRWRMKPGQLVIVDEASLADTKTLDAIVTQARSSGAKVVLVGDPAQLPAVGAGGAFAMLTHARPDPPTLEHIRRFKNPDGSDNGAEAAASIGLRDGDPHALGHYRQAGRIHTAADGADPLQQAHAAWQADRAMGLRSILIAADNATVTALNHLAQADLIETGQVQPGGALLADGTRAGIGDRIVTRKVDRHVPDGTARSRRAGSGALTAGFVTNGAAFTVTGQMPDGGLVVRAEHGTPVTLPADYVARHVQLGYAVTAHRAQGTTVDTTHVVAAAGMTREAFYVAMTRGRYANHAHVITDQDPDADQPNATSAAGTQAVLEQILANTGQQLSAHDTRAELEHQAQQWVSRRQVDAIEPPARTGERRQFAPVESRRGATTISRSPGIRHALPPMGRTRPTAAQDRSHDEVIR